MSIYSLIYNNEYIYSYVSVSIYIILPYKGIQIY